MLKFVMLKFKVSVLLVVLAGQVMAGCSGNDSRAGSDRDAGAFCERARSLEDAIDIDPQNPDPVEIGRTAEALEELSVLAPDEINAQVSSAGGLMREFSDLLESVDVSDPAAVSDPAFQERLASLQERDGTLGSDLEEVANFLATECDIEGQSG